MYLKKKSTSLMKFKYASPDYNVVSGQSIHLLLFDGLLTLKDKICVQSLALTGRLPNNSDPLKVVSLGGHSGGVHFQHELVNR